MTKHSERLFPCLLLLAGVACSGDQQRAEGVRPAGEFSGSETAIIDSPDEVPTNPDQNLPGEPGSISPTTRSRASEIASDVEGVLPGDEPPPPVVPIDEPTPPQAAQRVPARATEAPERRIDGARAPETRAEGADRADTANKEEVAVTRQGTTPRDLQITQRIREAVMENDQLSFTAKNVQVITKDGKVYLRGPVRNQNERRAIEKTAVSVAGRDMVTNELEVK